MSEKCNQGSRTNQFRQSRQAARKWALAAATGAIAIAGSAFGQTQLFYDQNGATSGLGTGAGPTWDNVSTDVNWATTSAGTTVGAWVPGDIAVFDGALTANIGDNISLSGIIFNPNGTNEGGGNAIQIGVTAAGYDLNFGTSNFTIAQNTTAKHVIAAPIVGSGDMTIIASVAAASSGAAPINLAGDMSQFTGSIYVENNLGSTAPTLTNASSVQINSPLGAGGTIYLDQYSDLYANNNVVGAGTAGDPWTGTTESPSYFTLSNNVVLNYNGVAEGATNTTNTIGVANGPTVNGIIYSLVEVFSGVISSPAGITTNLNIAGTRGTTILANQETYNGNTTITVGNNNGMVQFAYENALPATTTLILGDGAVNVGVTDLDGYDETIAGLATGTTSTAATGVGNIYNLSVNNSTVGFYQNINNGGVQNSSNQTVTLTVTPVSASTNVFNGDIGDTSTGTNPLNDNVPYENDTTAYTNISLVLNGPTTGGGSYILALAPVSALANGNEYTGTTTVNSNATLVFARTGTYALGTNPGGAYTITGGGTVTVNNGGTLASLSTASLTYAGGTQGNIVLGSGSSLLIGQATTTSAKVSNGGITNYTLGSVTLSPNNIGILSTNSMTVDSGASMTFELASKSSFDQLYVNGGLTLDTSDPTHTINIGLTSTGSLAAGTYPLIVGSINGDGTNADGSASAFTLNTSSITTVDHFKLLDVGNALDLQVLAPVLQWDPTGGGLNTDNNTDVAEGGGAWNEGSPFLNLFTQTEANWANGAFPTYDVQFGNDKNQAGGVVTLGENIVVGGALKFGDVYPGTPGDPTTEYWYIITDGGSGNTLTLNGGILVHTDGGTANGGPSAEIDAPIVLGADQTWEVDSTDFLQVGGTLSGAHTLTMVGDNGGTTGGTLYLDGAGGSIGALDANGGTVLLAALDAIGNAPINFDGGALEVNVTGTLSNPITVGTNGGEIGAAQPAGGSVILTLPQNITTTNTLTIFGSGTVNLTGTNSFGTLAFSGSSTTNVTSIANLGSTSALQFTGGTLAMTGISTLSNPINTGGLTTTGGLISDNVPLTVNNLGTIAGGIAFSDSSGVTLNVQTNAAIGALGAISAGTVITKTGAGTLTLGGYTGTVSSTAGTTLIVANGTLAMTSSKGLGGANSSTAPAMNLVLNSGTELIANFSTPNQNGGSITLNDNTSIVRPNGLNGETGFSADSAADVVTINGHVLIDDQALEGTTNIAGNLAFINPVVVTTGSVLTAENDNSGGYESNDAINFRGAAAPYVTFTIQHGATVEQTGPGGLRFGRVTSDGIPIIGQGTPGSEALLQLGNDAYMTDVASPNITQLVVDGQGTAGLRIEAPMNATYVNPASNPPVSESVGTTGLFGIINGGYSDAAADGSVYTVLSPNRAAALNSPYSDGTNTFTPSGTLTLAATDAGGATGIINVGPTNAPGSVVSGVTQGSVSLALDNTTSSRGNLVYEINPASTDGGNFANFAGLTVEHTYNTATVTAQLLGTTKIPALTISGGAKLDIRNEALVVDPTNGSQPLAQIAGYLASGYDNGKWDGTGIFSSVLEVGGVGPTSIGYGLNSALATPFTIFGGQPVDNNAVLVRYTWLGDLNLDGVVDSSDEALMGSIPTSGPLAGQIGWFDGDLNYDGVINADDYSLFALGDASQTGQLPLAVPEPASLSMLALGAGALLRRRRRA